MNTRNEKENISFYLGEHLLKCYAGYCNDPEIRKRAAAGGIVSGVLLYLLNHKLIDGALVCRTLGKQGKITHDIKIATTTEEILACAKSSYWDIPILQALDSIRAFQGKVAFVGLPCHINQIRKLSLAKDGLREKICYTIGLFCGGNNQRELLVEVLKQKGIRENDVRQIVFHRYHVKGAIEVFLNDECTTSIPFHHFNVYRMLHFYPKKLCRYCCDHTAEFADLSVGDIFTKDYKRKSVKYSSFIVRTPQAQTVLDELIRQKKIVAEQIIPSTIFQSQKKSLKYRKNMSARQLAAKFWKIHIPLSTNTKVHWNDYFVAWCYLLNETLSEKPWFQKVLFHIPKPFLYAYIVLLKSLSNF